MNKRVRLLAALCLAAATPVAQAQFSPSQDEEARRMRREMRDFTPERREQWREGRRERRDQWLRMSPEERQQFRRDIRDAGRDIYPRRQHRGRD